VKLAAQYGEKLEVLAFPCNQFLGQEPDDAEQVETCMRAKFDVNFRTMEKVRHRPALSKTNWTLLSAVERSLFLRERARRMCLVLMTSVYPASVGEHGLNQSKLV